MHVLAALLQIGVVVFVQSESAPQATHLFIKQTGVGAEHSELVLHSTQRPSTPHAGVFGSLAWHAESAPQATQRPPLQRGVVSAQSAAISHCTHRFVPRSQNAAPAWVHGC
jgi:hypothetical protein